MKTRNLPCFVAAATKTSTPASVVQSPPREQREIEMAGTGENGDCLGWAPWIIKDGRRRRNRNSFYFVFFLGKKVGKLPDLRIGIGVSLSSIYTLQN